MRNKFLLCRPEGGLNDLLCQVEKCCRYAEITGRTVIVDTNYKNSHCFKDDLGKYFSSKQRKLIISIQNIQEDFENMSVFPHFLSGRLNSYATHHIRLKPYFIDTIARLPITFNFSRDYPEQLIVHHMSGGGTLSTFSLLRLKLSDKLLKELEQRIVSIGGEYSSIHIRHTDYKSDFYDYIKVLTENPPRRLFVATDNQLVLDEFKSRLINTEVFNFSKILSKDGKPIHYTNNIAASDIYLRNQDAIIDLLLLALSKDLRICRVIRQDGTQLQQNISGFSRLAYELWGAKSIIKHLISPSNIQFGLE